MRGPQANGRTTGSEEQAGELELTLARALGWGSLGLGIPQLTMPGRFDRAIGIDPDLETRAWTLVVGVRELAAAAGILRLEWPRPRAWLWARVAGDVKDLMLLVSAWGKRESTPRLVGAIGGALAIGAADVFAAVRMTRRTEQAEQAPAQERREEGPLQAKAQITVRASRDEVYAFWHDFQNLPRFMAYLEEVQQSDGRSHWKAKAPMGRTVEWDAETTRDVPGETIAWRSLQGGMVSTSGAVRFVDAPGDRGTEIHLDLEYDLPGGAVTATIAKVLGGDAKMMAKDDLRRFKQVVETGEVVRSEGSPEGQLTSRLIRQRPAQPLETAGSRS
jgi:uncharacterized membrane protein